MIKLKLGDSEIIISTETAKEVAKQLNADEIMDAVKQSKGEISVSTILTTSMEMYEGKNLLHSFFNHRSDASLSLEALEQETMEEEFSEWLMDFDFEY